MSRYRLQPASDPVQDKHISMMIDGWMDNDNVADSVFTILTRFVGFCVIMRTFSIVCVFFKAQKKHFHETLYTVSYNKNAVNILWSIGDC